MKKIVIDILGGDNNAKEILEGLAFMSDILKGQYSYVLAGPKDLILSYFREDEVEIIDTDTDVTNATNPMSLLHDMEDAALVKCYSYMKTHEDAVGLITVASTGCVLVGSIFKLGLLPGIQAPVLGTELISHNGKRFFLCDCGANVDSTAKQMLSFAKVGNGYMKALGVSSPKIALANIGSEDTKGNKLMKESFTLLKSSNLNFIGNVEFTDIYRKDFDVLVSEGTIGNCIIKTVEGLSKVLISSGKIEDLGSSYIDQNFNYNDQGAAILLGPSRIILKAHGAATKETMLATLKQMVRLADGNLIDNLKKEFEC